LSFRAIKNSYSQFQKIAHQHLSVVYFLPFGTSRTIKIRMSRVAAICLVVVTATAWSLFSSAGLILATYSNQELYAELEQARKRTFKYQVKYEQVFERAYPQINNQPIQNAIDIAEAQIGIDYKKLSKMAMAAESRAQGQSSKSVASKLDSATQSPKLGINTPELAPTQGDTAFVAKSPIALSKTSPDAIEVKSLNAITTEHGLQIDFQLVNRSNKRAKGYVFALAKFEDRHHDQAEQYVAAPLEVGFDNTRMTPTIYKNADKFAMSHMRLTSFYIPRPREPQARQFAFLKIYILDLQGQLIKIVDQRADIRHTVAKGLNSVRKPKKI
jgi:hypothetical protein